MEAILQENINYYDNLKKECFEYYDKNFRAEYIKEEDRGILTHVPSGKSYSWTNWGRTMSTQLTRMNNFLARKLNINIDAVHTTYILKLWINERI